ncbi:MAG: YARHG domain-containing protein [Spirochaetes bacterium]|nr:YARHG domain-containing protein [Spirochaetota bacterium]
MKKMALFIISLTMTTLLAAADLNLPLSKPLTGRDLAPYSLEEIVLLRNSVFARHGYVFKSKALDRYFKKCGWYRPDKKFSYSRLSRTDTKNIELMLKEEKIRLDNELNAFYNLKLNTHYYRTLKQKKSVPAGILKAMTSFMKDKTADFVHEAIKINSILAAEPSGEISRSQAHAIKLASTNGSSYWEAGLDNNGRVRKLKHCSCESDTGFQCRQTLCFHEDGRLFLAEENVMGTINYQYIVQYLGDEPLWFVFDIVNGAAGAKTVSKKFFVD